MKAFDNEFATKAIKTEINKAFLLSAKLLYENYKKEYYLKLGYETFEDYLSQEGLDLYFRQATKLILVYEAFAVYLKVDLDKLVEIDYNKLSMLLPLIKKDILNSENLDDWLSLAQANSYFDLKENINNALKK